MKHEVIFLIGYRGSGKTSLARLLAKALGWTWCDADAVLEAKYCKTIKAIFAEEGEPGFRDKESAILAELASNHRQVVATGGGVILRETNRRLLEKGFVIWLTAPAEILFDRMQTDPTTLQRRPDLAGGGLAEVRELLARREPFYAQCADLTISTAEHPIDEIVNQILGHPAFHV